MMILPPEIWLAIIAQLEQESLANPLDSTEIRTTLQCLCLAGSHILTEIAQASLWDVIVNPTLRNVRAMRESSVYSKYPTRVICLWSRGSSRDLDDAETLLSELIQHVRDVQILRIKRNESLEIDRLFLPNVMDDLRELTLTSECAHFPSSFRRPSMFVAPTKLERLTLTGDYPGLSETAFNALFEGFKNNLQYVHIGSQNWRFVDRNTLVDILNSLAHLPNLKHLKIVGYTSLIWSNFTRLLHLETLEVCQNEREPNMPIVHLPPRLKMLVVDFIPTMHPKAVQAKFFDQLVDAISSSILSTIRFSKVGATAIRNFPGHELATQEWEHLVTNCHTKNIQILI